MTPSDDIADIAGAGDGLPERERGMVRDAVERAERDRFTEPPPATAGEQVRFLLEKVKGSTRALARRLGVTQRTVQRYRKGQITQPRTATREAMAEETATAWQPEVREQVRETASSTGGLTISTRCTFGFTSPRAGGSDDPRERRITQRVGPHHARAILAAQESGADEDELLELVAAALAEAYFQEGGSRADGLQVTMSDVRYLDLAF
ncbi:hypothetical protein [Streptacidiphilus sp. MAP5-52]|uniref:telomere-protecting terminal protein Tpg n=1 Tax=Streptacidiphilus sp. MAP5-52 TaxID=3156267 RepID=UPI003515A29D